jgi:hypothetical protein
MEGQRKKKEGENAEHDASDRAALRAHESRVPAKLIPSQWQKKYGADMSRIATPLGRLRHE